jgi:hypothetical protein
LVLAQAELDIAQLAVTHLRWLQPTDDAHAGAVRIVDDNLDRIDVLGESESSRATLAHKPAQLGAHIVVEGFMEAHPYEPALLPGQAKPIVQADRDVYAPTDQSPRPVRPAQLHPGAVMRTVLRVHGPSRFIPGGQRQIADTGR